MEWLETDEGKFWCEVTMLAGEVPVTAVICKIQARYPDAEDQTNFARLLEFNVKCLEQTDAEYETDTGEAAVDLAKAAALREILKALPPDPSARKDR